MLDIRRDFLKTTGILSVSSPLMGANMSLLEKSKRVTSATHWGISEVTIRNGVIVDNKSLKMDKHPSMKIYIRKTFSNFFHCFFH